MSPINLRVIQGGSRSNVQNAHLARPNRQNTDLEARTHPDEPMPPLVKLLFAYGAPLLKVKVLEREIAELKAQVKSQEEGVRSWGD